MQRVHQLSAALFAALSIVVVVASWKLEYYSSIGPGPGFFPIWLGGVMAVLSVIWLFQVTRRGPEGPARSFLPPRDGLVRIGAILGALASMALLMDTIGFQVSMFLFLGFLLLVLGGQRLWVTGIAALVGSAGIFHVLVRYLDLPLPTASIGVLNRLGL
jgi:putative tricarboxylic transport membrane protein